ncbi:MAG: NifB/NifX family molybdenum-iron cluster-binding protein [Desulfobacterales bacterium]|jgi:predicted Fe-Mo cluster-binding NifX family protein|nr:NifB/NifX family molybdenum-iron cluster-binding protein [Desulfobacterales bacterium]MDD3081465.1 NifB/NifX family molybdenum-iron cluster-binding protein [Desulfobacterales bacterium]MDD3950380.1 NifB/NifX family molybdenum-iron cluster-binding protein [Desulfobacterales bacterium]MDD4463021.1 NifB/NifX family molybdenum-iron cluster-binding protein [Desulfobacterales bacterium]MDY0378220.1 NifB/NifX family molybdenum-iron cluster-binding protein [Desulfobacterales bacterium]
MKIAVPLTNGVLSAHFGHCEEFALLEIDKDQKTILGKTILKPPAHEPGVLPRWLGQLGVNVIIAGGMGKRAIEIFAENDINVLVGAVQEEAEKLVKDFLAGSLTAGINLCDH